jgi:hypothetical protein
MYVYCAFSMRLNIISLMEFSELYLFKFGETSRAEVPLDRFNNGWIFGQPETTGGHAIERSAPLALCND